MLEYKKQFGRGGCFLILYNFPLIASLIAILVAQVVKIPIAYFSGSMRTSVKLVVSTGGMPSSHSAAVSALITGIGLHYGLDSPYLAIALVFGIIVMYDSMAVRRQSGEQGIVIEQLIKELEKRKIMNEIIFNDPDDNEEMTIDEMVVNKYLGHKPTEVFAGVLTGVTTAIILDMIISNL